MRSYFENKGNLTSNYRKKYHKSTKMGYLLQQMIEAMSSLINCRCVIRQFELAAL